MDECVGVGCEQQLTHTHANMHGSRHPPVVPFVGKAHNAVVSFAANGTSNTLRGVAQSIKRQKVALFDVKVLDEVLETCLEHLVLRVPAN